MKARFFLGLAPLWLLGACQSNQRSLLVVEVNSNLTIPTELDAIDLAITVSGKTQHTYYSLTDSYRLPLRVGAVEAGDTGTIQIVVSGVLNHSAIVSETADVAFVEGESKLLKLYLARECIVNPCQDSKQTCTINGTCRTPMRGPSDLTPFVPGTGGSKAMGGSTGTGGNAASGGSAGTSTPPATPDASVDLQPAGKDAGPLAQDTRPDTVGGFRSLGVSKTGAGAGTVISSPPGITCGSTCSNVFSLGSVVTLTASANATSVFTGWTGNCTGTDPCTLTLDGDKTVSAAFDALAPPKPTPPDAAPPSPDVAPDVPTTAKSFSLTVTKSSLGTVTSSPAGINCGTICSADFAPGTVVTLTAIGGPSGIFTGWSGACTGTGTCTLTMDEARSVTSTFVLAPPIAIDAPRDVVDAPRPPDLRPEVGVTLNNLTVSKTGTGSGTVTSSQPGINCGANCSAGFAPGAAVLLTATPDLGSAFTGWSGACTGTTTCALTMDLAKTVTANFAAQWTLTVGKAGAGAGTVTSSPFGITCGAACSASFSSGSLVILTATPDGTSNFTGWSGACTGTGVCTVTMDAANTVTANFSSPLGSLNVSKTGGGSGTVTSSAPGISCGTTCSASFTTGTLVFLGATPDTGSTFMGWSGACSGTGVCVVTVEAATSVVANFQALSYSLTVDKSGAGAGTVASVPSGIACGSACSAAFASGATVTLTATPAASSTFTGWSGVCSGTGTCLVTMDAAKMVTANFALAQYGLTISYSGAGSGTITSSPLGMTCALSTCSGSFDSGTVVTLTATPEATSTFVGWSGACTGTDTCILTMNAAKSVTARFINNCTPQPISTGGIVCPGRLCTVGGFSGYMFSYGDGTASSICMGPDGLCTSGTTGAVDVPYFTVWGAGFGFNLSPDTSLTNIVEVQLPGTGVSVTTSSLPVGANLRLQVGVSGTDYYAWVTTTTQTIPWTSFKSSLGVALLGPPKTDAIKFQASSLGLAGSFDFCVTSLSFQ
jgi:hypothetical protein